MVYMGKKVRRQVLPNSKMFLLMVGLIIVIVSLLNIYKDTIFDTLTKYPLTVVVLIVVIVVLLIAVRLRILMPTDLKMEKCNSRFLTGTKHT